MKAGWVSSASLVPSASVYTGPVLKEWLWPPGIPSSPAGRETFCSGNLTRAFPTISEKPQGITPSASTSPRPREVLLSPTLCRPLAAPSAGWRRAHARRVPRASLPFGACAPSVSRSEDPRGR